MQRYLSPLTEINCLKLNYVWYDKVIHLLAEGIRFKIFSEYLKVGKTRIDYIVTVYFIPLRTFLPATALRRFKSSGESFELGLDTILSRLVVEPFSDSTVMVIPDVPGAPSAEVGHTHLA